MAGRLLLPISVRPIRRCRSSLPQLNGAVSVGVTSHNGAAGPTQRAADRLESFLLSVHVPANANSLWRWHRHRPDMPSGPAFLFRAGLIFVCKPTEGKQRPTC